VSIGPGPFELDAEAIETDDNTTLGSRRARFFLVDSNSSSRILSHI
jgi:hypothetical protein